MTFILGIDPGLSGACAVLTDAGEFVEVFDVPVMQAGGKQSYVKNVVNAAAMHDRLVLVRSRGAALFAYVESVSAMPKQGVASMFSLGHTVGTIQSVLACLHIPYVMVRPQEWKKSVGLLKTEKAQSRAVAIQRFPSASPQLTRVKDHNRAEAILLGHYGAQRVGYH